MINVNDNLQDVKRGILFALDLFKKMYLNKHNIILNEDNDLFINNIDRLLNITVQENRNFCFGFNFVLESIKNLRHNICVNPILYILSLEILVKNIVDIEDLQCFRGKFHKINEFLLNYYNHSDLRNVNISKKDIINLFDYDDSFLNEIIYSVLDKYNVEIQQDNDNKITVDSYYRLPAYHVHGWNTKEDVYVFITYFLDEQTYKYLSKQSKTILVLCHDVNFTVPKESNLNVFKVSHGSLLTRIQDIIKISGCSVSIDFDVKELQNYTFGHCKEYKFIGKVLYLSFDKYLTPVESEYLNKPDTKDRYYMVQGKNLTITCTEEYLETVRNTVTFIKAIQNNGIFYTEIKTLKLLLCYFDKDKDLQCFLYKLLEGLLKQFDIDSNSISEVINNTDLRLSYNPKTRSYTKDLFTSLDIYTNVFALLDSNIEVLCRVN